MAFIFNECEVTGPGVNVRIVTSNEGQEVTVEYEDSGQEVYVNPYPLPQFQHNVNMMCAQMPSTPNLGQGFFVNPYPIPQFNHSANMIQAQVPSIPNQEQGGFGNPYPMPQFNHSANTMYGQIPSTPSNSDHEIYRLNIKINSLENLLETILNDSQLTQPHAIQRTDRGLSSLRAKLNELRSIVEILLDVHQVTQPATIQRTNARAEHSNQDISRLNTEVDELRNVMEGYLNSNAPTKQRHRGSRSRRPNGTRQSVASTSPSNTCPICLDRRADQAIYRCGHCVCGVCAQRLRSENSPCPLCRMPI